MAERVISIDYLKVIATIAVIAIHSFSSLLIDNATRSQFWSSYAIESLTHWAVPVFLMISGFLTIRPTQSLSFNGYTKRLSRVVTPLIVWTLFYVLLQVVLNKSYSWSFFLNSMVIGEPYVHLWYMYILLVLTLLLPFISLFIGKIKGSLSVVLMSVLCFVYSTFILTGNEPPNFAVKALGYIPFYAFGYFLRDCKSTILIKSLFIVASLLLVLAPISSGSFLSGREWEVVFKNHHPLIIIQSITFFIICKSLFATFRGSTLLLQMSTVSAGVYFVHPFFILSFRRIVVDESFISALIVFVASTLLSYLLSFGAARFLGLKKIFT